jgi:predicted dienelactone hydrolase
VTPEAARDSTGRVTRRSHAGSCPLAGLKTRYNSERRAGPGTGVSRRRIRIEPETTLEASMRPTYDPFARGPDPVGVRSGRLTDERRTNRELPFEVWYPAGARHASQDADPATQDAFTVLPDGPVLRQAAARNAAPGPGRRPLVLFSHASMTHRRASSFLCTHLASHGYVVAAVDHTGNTAVDLAARAARPPHTPEEREAYLQQIIADRVPDLRFLLDQALAGGVGVLAEQLERDRVGLVGWSFGGWTVLAAPELDERVGAVVALAPAGGSNPPPGVIPVTLAFAWRRAVPTLYLVAEQDQFTPLPGQHELFDRTPARKRMFVLAGADHYHFGDQIDEPGACRPEAAHAFVRGLALAHLDAELKGDAEARRFLDEAALPELRARGVVATARAGTAPADE